MKSPKLQGTRPKRKRRFGEAIWFGNPKSITQKLSGQTVQTRSAGRSDRCALKSNHGLRGWARIKNHPRHPSNPWSKKSLRHLAATL
jgi:hypothetical protein